MTTFWYSFVSLTGNEAPCKSDVMSIGAPSQNSNSANSSSTPSSEAAQMKSDTDSAATSIRPSLTPPPLLQFNNNLKNSNNASTLFPRCHAANKILAMNTEYTKQPLQTGPSSCSGSAKASAATSVNSQRADVTRGGVGAVENCQQQSRGMNNVTPCIGVRAGNGSAKGGAVNNQPRRCATPLRGITSPHRIRTPKIITPQMTRNMNVQVVPTSCTAAAAPAVRGGARPGTTTIPCNKEGEEMRPVSRSSSFHSYASAASAVTPVSEPPTYDPIRTVEVRARNTSIGAMVKPLQLKPLLVNATANTSPPRLNFSANKTAHSGGMNGLTPSAGLPCVKLTPMGNRITTKNPSALGCRTPLMVKPLDAPSLGCLTPLTVKPLDASSLGCRTPLTVKPLDASSLLGRATPIMLRATPLLSQRTKSPPASSSHEPRLMGSKLSTIRAPSLLTSSSLDARPCFGPRAGGECGTGLAATGAGALGARARGTSVGAPSHQNTSSASHTMHEQQHWKPAPPARGDMARSVPLSMNRPSLTTQEVATASIEGPQPLAHTIPTRIWSPELYGQPEDATQLPDKEVDGVCISGDLYVRLLRAAKRETGQHRLQQLTKYGCAILVRNGKIPSSREASGFSKKRNV